MVRLNLQTRHKGVELNGEQLGKGSSCLLAHSNFLKIGPLLCRFTYILPIEQEATFQQRSQGHRSRSFRVNARIGETVTHAASLKRKSAVDDEETVSMKGGETAAAAADLSGIDSIDRLFRSPPSKKENNSNPKKNQWQYMWVLDKR
ncbi:MAG: hypothetical protein L6R39_002387 [Caloplaca ligustica]|nr:MAG: hypothetical protein L6R39_002387 [Caloplaca ligustica]